MERIESFRGEFRFLSNFHMAAIEFCGMEFPSVEHAFQASKTHDAAEKQQVANASTAGSAKRLGRRVTLRADWEFVKRSIMLELVRLKFQTHADLRQRLLATGDAELVEGNTWGDRYWGVVDGTGENHLGKILMQVRSELRQANA